MPGREGIPVPTAPDSTPPSIEVENIWDHFLAQVGPGFCHQAVTLILDITPFEEHAQVVYVGLLQQSRVLPLAWKVMPGQEEWGQGQWEIVAQLFERVARGLGQADCTLMADGGLSCLTLIHLCQAHGWHYVVRIKQDEYAQRKRYGTLLASLAALFSDRGAHRPVVVWHGAAVEGA